MDDHYDNIDPEDAANMNGRHDPIENTAQNEVFAKLFAMDQQPDPSPRFVAQLGSSLMPSAGKKTLLSATTSMQEPTSEPQPLTEAAGSGKRRRPIISFGSAAVLMVIVVLVGYAVTLWAVENSNHPPAYMAFSSTFEASSTATITGCYVEPKALVEVTTLVDAVLSGFPVGDAYNDIVVPDSSIAEIPEPGEPVNRETLNRLDEVYGQFVSCLNGRDRLRMYALFTNDGIARMIVTNGRLHTQELAKLSAPPEEGFSNVQFGGFERAELLADGRVAAYLPSAPGCGNSEMTPMPCPDQYAIFKEVNGHWLIDDLRTGRG